MKKIILILNVIFSLTLTFPASAGVLDWLFGEHKPTPSNILKVTHFPSKIEDDCKFGRAFIYDECGSQLTHVEMALVEAKKSGKTIIVSYGAEWCIWCHVLDNYLRGQSGKFRYRLEDDVYFLNELATDKDRQQAKELNEFASQNLILLHIESRYSPDGQDALELLNAMEHYTGGLPYVFSVSQDGQYAASFPDWDNVPGLEIRHAGNDWYRGFERSLLQAELAKLIKTAQEQN